MIKMYKGGNEASVDPFQISAMEKSGWSKEPKAEKKATVRTTSAPTTEAPEPEVTTQAPEPEAVSMNAKAPAPKKRRRALKK